VVLSADVQVSYYVPPISTASHRKCSGTTTSAMTLMHYIEVVGTIHQNHYAGAPFNQTMIGVGRVTHHRPSLVARHPSLVSGRAIQALIFDR